MGQDVGVPAAETPHLRGGREGAARAVLVLHGGREHGRTPTSSWQLAYLRMLDVYGALRRASTDHDPVAGVRAALPRPWLERRRGGPRPRPRRGVCARRDRSPASRRPGRHRRALDGRPDRVRRVGPPVGRRCVWARAVAAGRRAASRRGRPRPCLVRHRARHCGPHDVGPAAASSTRTGCAPPAGGSPASSCPARSTRCSTVPVCGGGSRSRPHSDSSAPARSRQPSRPPSTARPTPPTICPPTSPPPRSSVPSSLRAQAVNATPRLVLVMVS